MQTIASNSALQDQLAIAERALAEAQSLLGRLLPQGMINRLREQPEGRIADHYASATVLFADLAGFVRMARSLGATRTVTLLDRLVCAFDKIADRNGVERIKTIGDGYMAVAGVPMQQSDHAARMARVAVEMRAVVAAIAAETGLDLELRIGIASGPVMAGMIGASRLAYDVWGDTVNLASRLEQAARPGEIVISDATRRALGAACSVMSLGPMEVRGYGVEETWQLEPGVPKLREASQ